MNFKLEIAKRISEHLGNVPVSDILPGIEVPPNPEMGDFAFPCFKLSKTLKKSPAIIAEQLSASFANDALLEKAQPAGAYLNFFINKSLYAGEIIKEIIKNGVNYGADNSYSGKRYLVDYSSPNIAKPFHVGHIPTTVIGHALYNVFKFLGCDIISINHLGDWGTQFGKLIVAYKNWGNEADVKKGGVAELMRLYVKFHDEAENNPALNDEARGWLVKMEHGDEEALALWKWFNDISLDEYKNNTYKRLGIDFDYYTGESFYNDKMADVARELKEKNLLKESDGAMIVDLENWGMPPCLILRRDGGTLYPTRDISAALYRKKTFGFDKCLYITCMDQNLHFAQWFKVVELMGNTWAQDLIHIPLGLINFEEGKLSTRKGHVILLDDLLNDAVKKTRDIIEEKNPCLKNKDEIAEMVGMGAVVFSNLYNSRIKDVSFSWERALSFEGESGPYVQYTHARAASILKKASGLCATGAETGGNGESDAQETGSIEASVSPETGGNAAKDFNFSGVDFANLTDEYSREVLSILDAYPQKIKDCAEKFEPFILSRALIELCQAFNKFYNANIVLTEDAAVRNARLALVYCVKTVLEAGLGLLGIKAPDEM
ncbi:MAG: arginine--tRNA ligase [Clostridiales bacterium]|jgi:arginyl-tRNA synthetase|nr:arginine--tRNA ligase [Clostridiales bacterium]